jgi:chromosome segregation ATPase
MTYDILIKNLMNGEAITITNPDGSSYLEHRAPNRTAISAVKAIQNLQNQLAFSITSINQLTKERNEMWETLEKIQEQNKKLQDEIKSLQSTKTSE